MLSLLDEISTIRWSVKTAYDLADDEIKEAIFKYCDVIHDTRLSRLCTDIWMSTDKLFNRPASKMHHTGVLGLAKHSLQTADYGLAILAVVDPEERLSRDLVLAGGLLHDVGKIRVPIELLSNDGCSHVDTGVELITEHFNDLDLNAEEKTQLLNVIDVHHTPFAFGTKKPFFTIEAYIVNLADSLSATFDCVIPQVGNGKINFYDHQFIRDAVFK